MPQCEMCGADSPLAKRVFLEGSLLMLCPKCSKFGKSTDGPAKEGEDGEIPLDKANVGPKSISAPYTGRGKSGLGPGDYLDEGQMVLVEDFHKRIFDARNKLGWTQEELARKINERKSIIAKLETKDIKPNDELRKKLEKALNIVLKEKLGPPGLNIKEEKRAMTLGDMVKMSKK
jgi:putative transcription factor